MGYFFKKNNVVDSVLFTGFVMGKGFNLKDLYTNGDLDEIAVLYNEFEEKLKELKVK